LTLGTGVVPAFLGPVPVTDVLAARSHTLAHLVRRQPRVLRVGLRVPAAEGGVLGVMSFPGLAPGFFVLAAGRPVIRGPPVVVLVYTKSVLVGGSGAR
jgi:hypothetical protein